MMKSFAVLLLPVLLLATFFSPSAHAQTGNFARNLQVCVDTPSKTLDTCLRETLEELRAVMPYGIEELNLAKTEPLVLKKLKFRDNRPLIKLDATFSDVVVRGLSNFITQHISADIDRGVMSISLRVPIMNITGNYAVNGKVFVLPFEGNGPFTTTLYEVEGTGTARILPVGPVGDQKLSVSDANIDFQIERANVRMDNLFNGGAPDLANTVNGLLSGNSKVLIEEVKPQIRLRMESLVENVMNNAFSQIPSDQFIRKLNQARTARGKPAIVGARFQQPPQQQHRPVPQQQPFVGRRR